MSQKALFEVIRSLSMRRSIRACSYYWEGTDGYPLMQFILGLSQGKIYIIWKAPYNHGISHQF